MRFSQVTVLAVVLNALALPAAANDSELRLLRFRTEGRILDEKGTNDSYGGVTTAAISWNPTLNLSSGLNVGLIVGGSIYKSQTMNEEKFAVFEAGAQFTLRVLGAFSLAPNAGIQHFDTSYSPTSNVFVGGDLQYQTKGWLGFINNLYGGYASVNYGERTITQYRVGATIEL